MRIGFVGLGIMGEPMVGHLAAAGNELAVFDVNAGAARRVVANHPDVTAAESPADLGRRSEVVITMLPDGNVVGEVATGRLGLIEGMQPGTLLLDTSSAQPWLTKQTAAALAEREIGMVDAPVSGAQWGAQAAELVFMVGGSDDDVARVRPLLDVLGREVFHVGPLGSGHIMKSINNTITAMTFIATAEGLALGASAGLNAAAMNEVLNASTGQSWITKNHIEQRILSRTFDDPFKLDLMTKDIGIATGLAREQGIPMPLSGLGAELYRAAALAMGSGVSLSELARWVERLMGSEIA
jgi:3-hydroxyisobutyrate dehydrogenase